MVSVVVVAVLAPLNAFAYDTFWHNACSGGVAQHYKFTPDVTNILQLGTFGPDMFGPAYDKLLFRVNDRVANLGGQVRKAGVLMHFDNLENYLDANWKYDYLFTRLAFNTASLIKEFYKDTSLNEGTRKILVLETLGASLHMVQDFYAHSDWIHFDFVKLGFPQKQNEWGQDYAPTWFQFRAVFGSPPTDGPETWLIAPHTGRYPEPPPPVPIGNFGVPLSHTQMNHDNSALFYDGKSQVLWHAFGAHPATDAASATAHQLYSVSTAAVASVEWVEILEQQEATVKNAIDFVKDWDVQKFNPAMIRNLSAGLEFVLSVSCVVEKWDGAKPPPQRKIQCGIGGTAARAGAAMVAFGTFVEAVALGDEYWGLFFTKNILERLTDGIGSQVTGKYSFDKTWLAKRSVPPANTAPLTILDGITIIAPAGATTSGNGSSVTVTSSGAGSVQVDSGAASETAAQAASEAQQQQPGQPPLTPDPPVVSPPDWVIGNGATIVAQRTINGKVYRCSAKGLSASQYNNARLACRSLRAT